MKLAGPLGIFGAVVLHVGFVLFGGLLFPADASAHAALAEVDLLSEADPEPDQEVEQKPEDALEVADEEPPPDASEIVRSLETPPLDDAPALEAASLSAIEAALSGHSAGGDFAQAMNFASGGRIGGTGKGGAGDDRFEGAFSLAEIDQQPRPIIQASPVYPAELRGKKITGFVTVIFVLDATGKVGDPRVEKSSHTAFDNPALSAVRKWRFEPAVRGGQRVSCKMRAPIRFPPN